jgi:hypothetical protein
MTGQKGWHLFSLEYQLIMGITKFVLFALITEWEFGGGTLPKKRDLYYKSVISLASKRHIL